MNIMEEHEKRMKWINDTKARFPAMFEDIHRLNFDVEEGWKDLIVEALEALHALPYQIKVLQIKEKFGRLRLYIDTHTPVTEGIIKYAEQRSNVTCESCGEIGSLTNNKTGWMKTYCARCKAADAIS